MARILTPRAGATIAVLAALALAGCSSGSTVYGGIQKIDAAAHTITLYNTTTYQVDTATDLSKFNVGDPVAIAYNFDPQTKKNVATSVARL